MKRIIRTALALALLVPAGAGAREVLTLDDAWQRVLAHHPALVAVAADLEARQADLEQAGRGLNPELGFEVENFAGSGEYHSLEAADLTLMLAQTWELGGKADSRRTAARAGINASRTAADLARVQLRADLTRAFVTVMAAQRKVVLADTLAHVADEDRKAVDRRVAAGAENRVEAQLARLAWGAARRERDRSWQHLQAARAALGALWNDDWAGFPEVEDHLDDLVPIPEREEIFARLDNSPAARLAAAEVVRSRATVDVARAQGKINLTTALGLRHFRGLDDNALVMTVGIPLLVRDTNRDAQRAAAADVARSEAEARAAIVDLKTTVAAVWYELASSQSDVLAIRRDMLPAAARAMEEAVRAFDLGRYSLTDVIIVRRAWNTWQLNLVDALARHHLAAAELAVLLGPEPAAEVSP